MMKSLFAASALALWAMGAAAQDDAELALIKQVMAKAQALSFQNNREYCGYLVLDEHDNMLATDLTKGRVDSCESADFDENLYPFASFHTHGAHVDGESYELPSYTDAQGDLEEQVDGYVATPGGRLWFINSQDRTIIMICDRGCVPADPRFNEHPEDQPDDFYTFKELKALEEEEY